MGQLIIVNSIYKHKSKTINFFFRFSEKVIINSFFAEEIFNLRRLWDPNKFCTIVHYFRNNRIFTSHFRTLITISLGLLF